MDQILGGLFGAGDDDDDETRKNRARDFVSRVETGDASQGYSTEEAVVNYRNVASQLPDDEYEQIAASALSKLSPEQRREFSHVVKDQAGVDLGDNVDDPQQLAGLTRQLRSGSGGMGGLLGGLLGGGGSGDDIMGALGGLMGGSGGSGNRAAGLSGGQSGLSGLLSNPIVKTVLGLIAAEGMKRFTGGGDRQERARITPSGDRQSDSGGGGILDSLLGGGGDRDSSSGRPLDNLFGGENDTNPDDKARKKRI